MSIQVPSQTHGQPQEIPRATKQEFEQEVNTGQNFVLIDARSAGAYQSSHLDLKHAIRIQPGTTQAHLGDVPRGLPIFTVCT